MADLLVIGGTGFFGKSILECFQQGGLNAWGVDRVIAMSRNAERLKVDALSLLDRRVELISADIGTTDYLPPADFVIHAAASTDAAAYLSRPLVERQNIQAGVYNYCKLAEPVHRNSKILYVSSGAVYGTQPPRIPLLTEDFVVTNPDDIPEGKRDYAFAKRDAEDAFRRLGEAGLKVGIARCFAFVGPWLPRDQHFAIGNFIRDGLSGRPIHVKATYPVYRSYMHADDLVRWLMTILDHADRDCPCFNVGSDQAVTMGQLAKLVAAEFSAGASIPPLSGDRIDRYVPSISKARDVLGLDIDIDLPNAIRKTIRSISSSLSRD